MPSFGVGRPREHAHAKYELLSYDPIFRMGADDTIDNAPAPIVHPAVSGDQRFESLNALLFGLRRLVLLREVLHFRIDPFRQEIAVGIIGVVSGVGVVLPEGLPDLALQTLFAVSGGDINAPLPESAPTIWIIAGSSKAR